MLMDIGLPNISGIEGVLTVKTFYPGIQVMMFTPFLKIPIKIFDAIRNGASGLPKLKKTPPQEIVEAVRELHNGGAPSLTASIVRESDPFFSPAANLGG